MRLYYNYGRYIAAQAKFVRPDTRAARIAFAQHYLEAWDLDDWKRVRFSDEVHFGWREYDGRTWVSRQRDTGIPLAFCKISLMRAKTGESLVYTAGRQ